MSALRACWPITPPPPSQFLWTYVFDRPPTYAGFADLFARALPVLQAYQPQLRRFRRPLIAWAGSSYLTWSYLGWSLSNGVLHQPLVDQFSCLPDFRDRGSMPFRSAGDDSMPILWAPWGLWTATESAGFAGPFWQVPDGLIPGRGEVPAPKLCARHHAPRIRTSCALSPSAWFLRQH